MQENLYKVILFYKFIEIDKPEKLRDEQKDLCNSLDLKGRILIAKEGINGTLEGKTENINSYKEEIKKIKIFDDIVFKESSSIGKSFTKLSIKVREEIVTLGVRKINLKNTAKKITAEELESLYEKKEDFIVLDLRNDFEIDVGLFEKTYNPKLRFFRDFAKRIEEFDFLKEKKVVAVCTGGIRCEKATCLLTERGFKDLYQLKDGIHTYIQKFPNSRFKGSLFVFDNRMTSSISEKQKNEVIGKCFYCSKSCEDFYSDDTQKPSKKIICCSICKEKSGSHLRNVLPTK